MQPMTITTDAPPTQSQVEGGMASGEAEVGKVERQEQPGGEGGAAAEDDDARHALGDHAGDGVPEPVEQRGDDDEIVGEIEDDGRRDGDPGVDAHRLSTSRSHRRHG